MDQRDSIVARHPERERGTCVPSLGPFADADPSLARDDGRSTAALRRAAAGHPLPASPPLAAQVGHPPQSSPYHDIRKGHTVTPIFGQFGGCGGRFEIGPHDGQIYGLRYDLRTGSHDPDRPRGCPRRSAAAHRGPVRSRWPGACRARWTRRVTFAEVNLQLNLTGGKTWHRLAPFVGAGFGLTFPSSTPADTSRFELGKKIYLAPMAGVRIFVTDRLSLRGEARALFSSSSIPRPSRTSPRPSPAIRPTTPTPSSPMAGSASGARAPWLLVGLGYSFSL